MKAIRVHGFGGPEVMKPEEVPEPVPGPGQVLVRVQAAGVNPIDTYVRSGRYKVLPGLPYIPGRDGAGRVEEIGDGVFGLKRGERVYFGRGLTGSYAEFALCEERQVALLPDHLSFSQGAGIFTPYATAYRALFQKARALPSEQIFIHGGSGAVGLAAIQMAVAA
ncbi:partial enoyl reductase, partial [Methylacidimicrobium cyclopophantes]